MSVFSILQCSLVLFSYLSESSELDELSSLPVGVSGRSCLGGKVGTTSVESSSLSAGRGDTMKLSVLLGGLGDPIDSGIISDCSVGGINHDNLKPLVDRVLTNPVRVQNSESSTLATGSLFGNGTKVSDKLLLLDTGILWLTIVDTLSNALLSVSSLNTDSVDDITLLGLISESVSLVGTRWLTCSVDCRQLSVLPSAKSENESHDIRLLLVPQLLEVLVCSH